MSGKEKNMQENRDLFSSKLGFILACIGSAVGMGNVWMFPYRVGQLGGGAFLLPYIIFVVVLGYTGLIGEFAFGRMTQTGPIGSFEYAMKSKGKKIGIIILYYTCNGCLWNYNRLCSSCRMVYKIFLWNYIWGNA